MPADVFLPEALRRLGNPVPVLQEAAGDLRHRALLFGTDRAAVSAGLAALAAGEPVPGGYQGRVVDDAGPVFLFSGQGSQWAGMTAALRAGSPLFAERLAAAGEALAPHTGWSLQDVLDGVPGAPLADAPDVVQPLLFATMTSLAAVWQAAGVHPAAVVGHSQGEISAACVAGALTLDEGARVVAVSSRAVARLRGGGMLSVPLPAGQVEELIAEKPDLTIGARNGSRSSVLSGPVAYLEALSGELAAAGVTARRVDIAYASHSAALREVRDEIVSGLAGLAPRPGQLMFVSTVTGTPVDTTTLDAAYWYQNLRRTIRLDDAVRHLLDRGARVFVEVAPHPVLSLAVAETCFDAGHDAVTLATLRRDDGGPERLLAALAQGWVHGLDVDWARVLPAADAADAADAAGAADTAGRAPAPAALRRTPTAWFALVRAHVAAVLRRPDAASVPPDGTLREIGLTSLGATDLAGRLAVVAGRALPPTIALEFPTVRALAAELARLCAPDAAAPDTGLPDASRPDVEDPIVITAMACRYPGADSPEALLALVRERRHTAGPFPRDRGWDLEALAAAPGTPGGSAVQLGGFLDTATSFDAGLFGISPREAVAMEPQQRVLLETAWELFERGGIDVRGLRGTATGVFVGAMPQDYGPRMYEAPETVSGYVLTGGTTSVVSGRIAYVFGLEGPALTIDTACSSSLVAVHSALRSLRSGECDQAVAGGVTVMSNPGMFVEFSRQNGLAPDARCKAFGAGADGTAWSEGVGLLLLERLSHARRHGRRALAVVSGSAVNQDGASNGLSAPSARAQARVLRQAVADAGLEPSHLDVVEAHGTGTALGDPIEARALAEVHVDRSGEPLYLGSLKSNIGHSQAAAGVGGLIKMVMAMQAEVLPATLHVEEPSTGIDWSPGRIRLLAEERPWPRQDRPRRAGISSFGISGTNSHVLIEEPPPGPEPVTGTPSGEPPTVVALPVSAADPRALRALAARLRPLLDGGTSDGPGEDPDSHRRLAHALATRRTPLAWRAVVLADGPAEAAAHLDRLAAGNEHPHLVTGEVRGVSGAVLMFPGQGAQWRGMAVDLAAQDRVFAADLDDCAAALRPFTGWSLGDVLRQETGAPSLDRVDVVQPALWAVMVSLARRWEALGLPAEIVIGHSQGEIAAAVAAGALALEDGARVVALRSLALRELAGSGAMASVMLPEEDLGQVWDAADDRLQVAVVNSPRATVVSGDPGAVAELVVRCERQDVRVRVLPVDYASHSRHVEQIRDRLLTELSGIARRPARVPMFSTVHGRRLQDDEALDAEYWYRNLRAPVRFRDAVRALADEGYSTFVEASPHPVLVGAVQETAGEVTAVGTLRRDQGGLRQVLASAAELYVAGHDIAWSTVSGPVGGPVPQLPTYPFQRRRYWLPAPSGPGRASSGAARPGRRPPLTTVELADGGLLVTARLSTEDLPWLADHAVNGVAVLPGMLFAELALEAAAAVGADGVEEMILHAPVVVPEGGVEVQVRVDAAAPGRSRLAGVHTRPLGERDWTSAATVTFVASDPSGPDPVAGETAVGTALGPPPEPAAPGRDVDAVDTATVYPRLADLGYDYGPAFRGLSGLWQDGADLVVEAALPDEAGPALGRGPHAALLDALLHPVVLGALDGTAPVDMAPDGVLLPYSWTAFRSAPTSARRIRARLRRTGPDRVSLHATDERGRTVFAVDELGLRRSTWLGAAGDRAPESLHRVRWTPVTSPPDAAPPRRVVRLDPATAAQGLPPDLAGSAGPAVAVLPWEPAGASSPERSVQDVTERTLALLQHWAAAPLAAGSVLVVRTENAADVTGADPVDPTACAVWGLVRSAQTEQPGSILLLDGPEADLQPLFDQALACGEPQLAGRAGTLHAPRLVRTPQPGDGTCATLPASWALRLEQAGALEGVRPAPVPEPSHDLAPGQVLVRVRAIGLNFRDVLIALGMYPGRAPVGSEASGLVIAVGPDVTGFAVGDRVAGLFPDGTGSVAITDHRLLIRAPVGWTDVQAATAPIAFLTAAHALALADVRPGQSVLVHAGTGGVGLAMLQLARMRGLDAFATASPHKWQTLLDLGIPADRIASSRTTEFEDRFRTATGGRGVDVVVNSLTGDLLDASLRLIADGGCLVELGKTDRRDPEHLADGVTGVRYLPFDLFELPPERIQALLAEISRLIDCCALRPLPVRAWDVRDDVTALRHLSRAGHIGKLALVVPPAVRTDGSALVVGGTGALGALVARHLVTGHGVRHLVLTGRRGELAPETAGELRALGATVRVEACDATDPQQVADLVASIAPEHPLRVVVHAAGVLDDAALTGLTPERLATVLRPKALAAWTLHRATERLDLDAFVLFSSIAGVLGHAGQGNYAAANAFLDGLAAVRRAAGLPATSVAWGYWEHTSQMTSHLTRTDLVRMSRTGSSPLRAGPALRLLDEALTGVDPAPVAARFDLRALRRNPDGPPPLLRALAGPVRGPAVRASDGPVSDGPVPDDAAPVAPGTELAARLSRMAATERVHALREIVDAQVTLVLGLPEGQPVSGGASFKELGFDSLTSVELRNRIAARTGLRLPATLAFDEPSPQAVARRLLAMLAPEDHTPEPVPSVPMPQVAQATGRAPVPARSGSRDDAGLEPIAVIGMAVRFPGARDVSAFWDLLASGTDAVRPVPHHRWDCADVPDVEGPGGVDRRVPSAAGFLDGPIDTFDPLYFRISPREAEEMDPQQRLLLEVAWEALDDAGLVGGVLEGTRTAVFASAIWQDYAGLAAGAAPTPYSATGRAVNMAANRLSYVFGLRGPSVTVDSACSSSLLAVHLACQSLRSGDAETALAGGSNLLVDPATMSSLTSFGGLAPDGRCKPFAASADGFGRGEGCGIVVLKPLARALADGDRIWGVIRGSAVNNDGRSNGLTAPSQAAQEEVIRRAYEVAGVDRADVGYVEAHGTGTSLGDPIEAQALGAVLGAGRPRGRELIIGSVKSNIGHLEAAAGVSGLIKTLLLLRHRQIPASLHFDEPNPHIDFDGLRLQVAATAQAWPTGRRLVAGVSSFGWGGTNVHVVVEGPPDSAAPVLDGAHDASGPAGTVEGERGPAARSSLLVLSAHTPQALRATAGQIAEVARTVTGPARTAALGHALALRPADEHRLAMVVDDAADAVAPLVEFAASGMAAGLDAGSLPADGPPRIAFVFPGQGAQWAGMAREVARAEPAFSDSLERCAAALATCSDLTLSDLLDETGDAERAARVDVVQPALWALQVSYAALWRSWGIEPDAVVGHSMGEVAAAHVAGVLDLRTAALVISTRSALLRRISGRGAMLATELTAQEADGILTGTAGAASVAVYNSPRSTVLAGDPDALHDLARTLQEREAFHRWVQVDVASHSPQTDPLLAPLRAALTGITPGPARMPFHSTVRRAVLGGPELDADYWAENLRRPVAFAERTRALLESGIHALVEIGPHPVLIPAVQQTADEFGLRAEVMPTARRDESYRTAMCRSLGRLFTLGADVTSSPAMPVGRGELRLPPYPWQRERYWRIGPPLRPAVGRVDGTPVDVAGAVHPLLAHHGELADGSGQYHWTGTVPPALALARDHVIGGVTTLPGTVHADLALEVADRLGLAPMSVHALEFTAAAQVGRGPLDLQVTVTPDDGGALLEVHARTAGPADGVLVATAELRPAGPAPSAPIADATGHPGDSTGDLIEQNPAELYRDLARRGVDYGPAYRRITRVAWSDRAVRATVLAPAGGWDGRFRLDPVALDAVLHASLGPLLATGGGFVSSGIERLDVFDALPEELLVSAELRPGLVTMVDLVVRDPGGRLVLSAAGLRIHRTAVVPASPVSPEATGPRPGLAPLDSPEAIEEAVRVAVGTVVRLAPERIGPDQPLRGLGIDSVMSLELRNRLEAASGLRLPATLIWNHPTVERIAAYLGRRIADGSDPAAAAGPTPTDPIPAPDLARPSVPGPDPAREDEPERPAAADRLSEELAELARLMESS